MLNCFTDSLIEITASRPDVLESVTEYFKNSDMKLYYYTSKYNKNLIPDDYFDKVYTDIEELISIITK